jgi:hypothetical protein
MSRLVTWIAAFLAAIALALPALAQGTLENDTNRYGGDYLSVRAQSVH